MPRTKVTIYDVARRGGVSAKTVSRVLNDKPGVGKETRERILGIIRELGYHPNIGAQSLRGSRKGCIGLTLTAPMEVAPISQDFFIWLFNQLHRVFGSHGERVCFDLNPYTLGAHFDYGRSVWDRLFSACVLVGPLAVNDTTIQHIHESGIPYLALARLASFPNCSSAAVDFEEGAYLSTRFLLERGHERIAMLKAFAGYQPGVERLRGYQRALREANIAFDERLVRSVTFGARNIANMVHRLLVDRKVTALLDCSCAEDAVSLREGSRRAGRKPGEDFELVVWTYTHNAAVLSEACAHVWLPVREAGDEGLELLGDWYRGEWEGPVNILYHPVLSETVTNGEIQRPRPLWDIHE